MREATATHYEQIPVETVKRMMEGLPGKKPEDFNLHGETPEQSRATLPLPAGSFCREGTSSVNAPTTMSELAAYPADLRELAQRIQEETDAVRMIELVEHLIAKFNEKVDSSRRRGL